MNLVGALLHSCVRFLASPPTPPAGNSATQNMKTERGQKRPDFTSKSASGCERLRSFWKVFPARVEGLSVICATVRNRSIPGVG